ncbi:hypothetical protein AVEN_125292-1 [Araneus ventricosus]|uniref:Uncharacterized protein n=1 Tax=Araneus ventricosus TaxID=182803 RepID=A0A4Y2EP77_ARAVE|nr:hypothetical protein AVEN_125292-1 [Araneus ventricosus]
MDTTQDSVLSSIIFEHACKQELEGVLRNMLEDKDLVSKVLENSTNTEQNSQKKSKIQPIFILISLLRKLHSLESFSKISKNSSKLDILPVVIELLETAYRQCNFISLKKFFTLTSELKLLDLLNLIVDNSESSLVVQKLNQHFPRWTATYRSNIEKNFVIENTKVLDKVEESHTQCRRLILKLAMDKSYKTKYMTEQYSNDMNRLMQESKVYILEVITALKSQNGCSVLEKMLNGDEMESFDSNDLGVQLLLDYVQPGITDDALLRFLDDFEPILNSQPATALSSCLLPIDTMSEVSDDENCEDSDQSESDYENSQDAGDHVKSFADVLPSVTLNNTPGVQMDLD